MLRNLVIVVMISSALTSCGAQNQKTTQETAKAEIKGETFGEVITADGAVNYEDLLAQIEGKDSLVVKIAGTVDAVCQMKGCWMNIKSADANNPEMMVKFKDYGFFVPKDIAGRKVIMQGVAYREITPVDELRHYAEDAGKSKEEIEAITEPKEELKFMASGVLLLAAESGK